MGFLFVKNINKKINSFKYHLEYMVEINKKIENGV